MARKGRLNPGGFAYGSIHPSEPAMNEPGRGVDAPLSPRGRLAWRIVWAVLALAAVAVVFVVALGD